MWSRKELIGAGGIAIAIAAGRLDRATRHKIAGYELIATRVSMDEYVRDAWQRSLFRQGRFQTYYEPVIVRRFPGAPGATGGQVLLSAHCDGPLN